MSNADEMRRGAAPTSLASLEVALNNLDEPGARAGAASADGHRPLYRDAN